MAGADVKLLFGVAMGGPEGDSEKQIKADLESIIKKIGIQKIKVGLDVSEEDVNRWKGDIETRLKQLGSDGKFAIKVAHVDIGDSALKDFRTRLNDMISTLRLDKAIDVKIDTPVGEVGGTTKGVFKEVAKDAEEATAKIAAMNAALKEISGVQGKISTAYNKAKNTADDLGINPEKVSQMQSAYVELTRSIEQLQLARKQGTVPGNLDETTEKIHKQQAAVRGLIGEVNKEISTRKQAAAEANKAAKDEENGVQRRTKFYNQLIKTMERVKEALGWTKAKSGINSSDYQAIEGYSNALDELRARFDSGVGVNELQPKLDRINKQFAESSVNIKMMGNNAVSLGDRLKTVAQRFTSWFTVSEIVMTLYRSIKKMVSAVIEIDTAMTELKKVTDETSSTYEQFLTNAAPRAKELGTTIADIVSATADFARLGYSIQDATKLADVAAVYKNVGDGIENIGDASESIISTMKAFGISAGDAMTIVDKFNEVGNNYAISSKGVGEALLRSASAMHAAGNTLDETIALATAANTIIQSPEKVGTTLKTISMFLRSAKTEAEEAGESTEGMVESVSKLRDKIYGLTKGKVDIQLDENTFKNTTQILRELSQVWGELTDINKASILEMIGGKRNANVTAALLENFQLVEDVIETSRNATGSAMAENEKYMDSIQGHIAKLKAAFQELSVTFVDSNSVKFFVDLGRTLLEILNSVLKVTDAFGGLKGALTAVAGIMITANADSIFGKSGFFRSTLPSIPGKLFPTLAGMAKAFQNAYNPAAALNGKVAGLRAGLSAATAAITPLQAGLAAATAALTIFFVLQSQVKKANQERIDAMNDAAKAANEERESLASLVEEYKKLASSGITNDDDRTKARDIQQQISDLVGEQASNLDLVNGKLDKQLETLGNITKEEAKRNEAAIQAKLDDATGQYNAGRDARDRPGDFLDLDEYSIDVAINRLGYDLGNATRIKEAEAGKNAQELLDLYRDLLKSIQQTDEFREELTDGSNNHIKVASDRLLELIEFYEQVIDEYQSAEEDAFKNKLAMKDVASKEDFDAIISGINETYRESDELRLSLIRIANEAFPEFAQAATNATTAMPTFDDAYKNAKSGFAGVAESIEQITAAMGSLNKLQDELANGFTMSIDKALEFAKTYPEILNNAQVAADGQITLNEDVVNSFLEGKRRESDAQIDAKIAELQAERDANAGKMQLAQAELQYLTDIANGKINVTRGEAEYKLNIAKAVAKAMIDSGMQESEAYAMAAAYMSDDLQTFAQVAFDAAKNTDYNMSEAARSAAENLHANMENGKVDVASLAGQAQDTARAIAGMGSGKVAGSSVVKPGSRGGTKRSGSLNGPTRMTDTGTGGAMSSTRARAGSFQLTWSDVGGFNGSDFTFTDSGLYTIDQLVANLGTEISDYQSAIANLDGQIAALKALKGRTYGSGSSSSRSGSGSSGGSGGSGGSSSSSGDAELDRLKNIVSLLETELKLLEAQDAPAKSRIAKVKEIQNALQDEINYLKRIGGDQETINNLTIKWLNYQKEIEEIHSKTTKQAKDAVDNLVSYVVKKREEELKKEKEAIDKQLDALKKFYDKQKEMLRDQYDEEKYLEEQAAKRKKIADIQAQLDQLKYDNSAWAQKRRLELEQELADAKKELDDFEKDHALEVTQDQLDEMYEMQAAQLQDREDAIDETLNNEVGMYEQALEDIKNGGIDLYNELMEWNLKYGDHIAETITSAWEEAYKALQNYKDLYGSDYNGVTMANATGYTPPSTGGSGSVGRSSSGSSSGSKTSGNSYPYGKASATKGNIGYGDRGNDVKAIQYALNQLGYGNSGTKSLDGIFGAGTQSAVRSFQKAMGIAADGIVGNDTRGRFRNKGYASGTNNATPGIHRLYENGDEYIFSGADGNRYRMFSGGEKVLSAPATNFLYWFANTGGMRLFDMIGRFFPKYEIMGGHPGSPSQIRMGDIIIYGNTDKQTVSEIRRAQRDGMNQLLKEFNRLGKK